MGINSRLLLLLVAVFPEAYSFCTVLQPCREVSSTTNQFLSGSNNNYEYSRKEWIVNQGATLLSAIFFSTAGPIVAEATNEETTVVGKKSFSIEKCNTASKFPCVSTANVKNLDLYLPPWTFSSSQYSAAEIMSRLKGALEADPSVQIVQQEGNEYLKAEAKRSDLFGTVDELEFVLNPEDEVVFFRSLATSDTADFGVNKKRLEEIRKRAGVFGVMGQNMNSADSSSYSERGYGPLGQLKAFYGLQSGGGFEDVVLE